MEPELMILWMLMNNLGSIIMYLSNINTGSDKITNTIIIKYKYKYINYINLK